MWSIGSSVAKLVEEEPAGKTLARTFRYSQCLFPKSVNVVVLL